MKVKTRLTALVASTVLVSGAVVAVAPAPPAAAGNGPRCYYADATWYLGMESLGNGRLSRVDIHTRGCQSRKGNHRALDDMAFMNADIHTNSVSKLAGVEWHVRTPFKVSDDRWTTRYVVTGWWRECVAYLLPICGPTGDFWIESRYMSNYLLRRSTGISRWTFDIHRGEYRQNPGIYDRRLAIYKTP